MVDVDDQRKEDCGWLMWMIRREATLVVIVGTTCGDKVIDMVVGTKRGDCDRINTTSKT